MSWSQLFHLGDLTLTLPAGSAVVGWLVAARARRAALGWALVFGLALGLVAASKVAFLGWATGMPALGYKAASGHAAGFTAAVPTLCWLLARRCAPAVRGAVALLALAAAATVALALVRAGQHTVAEAVAGWVIGLSAFLRAVRLTHDVPAPPAGRALVCVTLASGATAWAIHSVSIGDWMVRLALALSGNPHPYR